MTLEEQQYDEKCYNYFDNIDDDDDEVIEIPHDMFDFGPTTETTTHMPTMIEEEPNPPVIDNITTVHTTDTVHTIDTTETNKVIKTPILSPTPASNNYYDNIDNKILRNEESTIVFEDDSSATTTVCTDNPNDITIKDLLSNVDSNVKTHRIAIPSTNTTHTQPKDRTVSVISNKKKKKQWKAPKTKTSTPLKTTHKKQHQESWNNAKKNHSVIGYMHHAKLAVDQSNEIHQLTFCCYFDPHGNTTRYKEEKYHTSNNSTSKDKLEENQQEGRTQVHDMVGHTKTTETMSVDTGGDIRRRREGIHVSRTMRSRRSRSRTWEKEKS